MSTTTKISIKDLDSHIELTHSSSETYSKCLFFFLGFDQQAKFYINRLSRLILDKNLLNLKINIIKMKAYQPNKSVSFFYSQNELDSKKEIHSYYRIDRDKFNTIHEIYWDACVDMLVIEIIKSEYVRLNHDWKNILFSGFSMGGRYAIHLVELLNAKIDCLILVKTYIMQYFKGESTLEKVRLRSEKRRISKEYLRFDKVDDYNNHPQLGEGKHEKVSQTFYSYEFNTLDEISVLFSIVKDFLDYQIKNDLTMKGSEENIIDNMIVFMFYSLEDPLNSPLLEYNLQTLQDQIRKCYLSFDNDDRHSIDSFLNRFGEILLERVER